LPLAGAADYCIGLDKKHVLPNDACLHLS